MKTQIVALVILFSAAPCIADVVTTKGGTKYAGTVTQNGDVVTVAYRFQGITVTQSVAKADVVSIETDDKTKLKPLTPEEITAVHARIDAAKQAGAANEIKALADAQEQADKANAIIEQLNALSASIANVQRKRTDTETRIATLKNQADADVDGAYRDYRIEMSVPHPDNHDTFQVAALETRDNKIAAIRSQYGMRLAELQATVAQCDRDLEQLNDAYDRKKKTLQGR